MTDTDHEKIRDLYYNDGYTWGEIAKMFGLKTKTMKRCALWGSGNYGNRTRQAGITGSESSTNGEGNSRDESGEEQAVRRGSEQGTEKRAW